MTIALDRVTVRSLAVGLALFAGSFGSTRPASAQDGYAPEGGPGYGGPGYGAPGYASGGEYGQPAWCPPGNGSRPTRWSREWYADEAQTPVGTRQKYKKGKLWPPFPRPTGKEQQFSHRFHAAHYWPYPYKLDDRASVRQYSAVQIDSGWTTATTLYDYHFDDDTHGLNHAGRLHVRWILESAPIQRRTFHVQYGLSPEVTEQRLASVRQEAASLVGPGQVPPILVRVTSPVGRPASEIVAIRRAEIDSVPSPRISEAVKSGGGGGGGAAAGGGGGGGGGQQGGGL